MTDTEDGWALRFEGVQPDWIEKDAKVQVALALAVGEQQLDSDVESLQLRLGLPPLLDVLVKLIGHINGKEVILNATGSLTETGNVEVTLAPYLPFQLDDLTLYVAPLLADPAFETAWDSAPLVNESIHFEQCHQSAFLQARFQLCNSSNGWSAKVASISLDPWHPDDSQIVFFIVPRQSRGVEDMGGFARKQHKVQILLMNATEASEWAVPTAKPTWWNSSLSESWQCHFPSRREVLWSSPGAVCKYMRRGCYSIEVVGPYYNFSNEADYSACYAFRGPTATLEKSAMRISQFLLCAREAEKAPKWATSAAWRRCGPNTRLAFPDALCTELPGCQMNYIYYGSPKEGDPFLISWFIGKLGSQKSNVSEEVVIEGCKMLLDFSEGKDDKMKLEADFLLSAVATDNAPSVHLILSHCSDLSSWNLPEKSALAKRVWPNLLTRSKAADILSVLLKSSLAEGMLVGAASTACFECAVLVRTWGLQHKWEGWMESSLSLSIDRGHGVAPFLEVLTQLLQVPGILSGIQELKVGEGGDGRASDAALAGFTKALTSSGQNLTELDIGKLLNDVRTGAALQPLGPLPLLQKMVLTVSGVPEKQKLPADAVKALLLDASGNFKFPQLKDLNMQLLDDAANKAWQKIRQLHEIGWGYVGQPN